MADNDYKITVIDFLLNCPFIYTSNLLTLEIGSTIQLINYNLSGLIYYLIIVNIPGRI
jgi:hypothetical protein